MAFIGKNVTIEIEKTLDTAVTVTALTTADPGVATATSHGLLAGDIIVFTVAGGMVELDGQAVRVGTVADANTFELEDLDTSDYSTWTAGTCEEVTAWETLGNSQTISAPDPSPEKIDTTTLLDKVKQSAFGLPEAPDGTITGLYDPAAAGVLEVKAATKANEDRVLRVSWAGGETTLFNALMSGGSGFDLQQNQAATANISFTPVKDIMYYAT